MTDEDFDIWVATIGLGVEGAPKDTQALLAADDGDSAIIVGCEPHEMVQLVAHADQLFAAPRHVAAMATRVAWSPTEHGESSPAWSLAIVDRVKRSWFGVRRDEDDHWWRLDATMAPWFMLSSASALRAMMSGEPMALKKVEDSALLKTPWDAPTPKLDEKGRL